MNTVTPFELATLAVLIAQTEDGIPSKTHVDQAVELICHCSAAIRDWRQVTDSHPDPSVNRERARLNALFEHVPAGSIIYKVAADEIERNRRILGQL